MTFFQTKINQSTLKQSFTWKSFSTAFSLRKYTLIERVSFIFSAERKNLMYSISQLLRLKILYWKVRAETQDMKSISAKSWNLNNNAMHSGLALFFYQRILRHNCYNVSTQSIQKWLIFFKMMILSNSRKT